MESDSPYTLEELKEKLNILETKFVQDIIKAVGNDNKIRILRAAVLSPGYKEWLQNLKKLEELKQIVRDPDGQE